MKITLKVSIFSLLLFVMTGTFAAPQMSSAKSENLPSKVTLEQLSEEIIACTVFFERIATILEKNDDEALVDEVHKFQIIRNQFFLASSYIGSVDVVSEKLAKAEIEMDKALSKKSEGTGVFMEKYFIPCMEISEFVDRYIDEKIEKMTT